MPGKRTTGEVTEPMNIRVTEATRRIFRLVVAASEMTSDQILRLMCQSLEARIHSLKEKYGINPWRGTLDANLIQLILFHDLGRIDDKTFDAELKEIVKAEPEWTIE